MKNGQRRVEDEKTVQIEVQKLVSGMVAYISLQNSLLRNAEVMDALERNQHREWLREWRRDVAKLSARFQNNEKRKKTKPPTVCLPVFAEFPFSPPGVFSYPNPFPLLTNSPLGKAANEMAQSQSETIRRERVDRRGGYVRRVQQFHDIPTRASLDRFRLEKKK